MSVALFVAAHPDDETLKMGVPIAEHVTAGQDVHILWLTDGEGSAALNAINGETTAPWWGVRHNPTGEGYTPLTAQQFGAVRVNESRAAVFCLAAGLPGRVTLHRAGLPDGGVTKADVEALILAVADEIAPGDVVRLKTHTWRSDLDTHPDHLAAGAAVLSLSDHDPVRFGDRRFYLLPRGVVPAGVSVDSPASTEIRNRVVNAVRAYQSWQPERGVYAVGAHSVGTTYMPTLLATVRSLYHP